MKVSRRCWASGVSSTFMRKAKRTLVRQGSGYWPLPYLGSQGKINGYSRKESLGKLRGPACSFSKMRDSLTGASFLN